ncbi:MAG TPA: hypothetical protein VG818_10665 [Gemmatimonadaceae bacterium]|jgi:hypothetical protein|nr:hypothetical protein [Gemmatimonadaceae bacterium]
MDRPKQQAFLFLAGAVLVGAVLGYSADRLALRRPHNWADRTTMYEDLGLSAAQRTAMDSLFDDRNCQIRMVMKPVEPVIDSIRLSARKQMRSLMTPDQLARLDARVREDSIRHARNAKPTRDVCKK